jgi:SAM-dependent methyltransferase
MPGVDVNRQLFGERYDWPEQGDEWSAPWGGTATQWYASIVPRLHPFLPARRVLEIAPGFGRWSSFLIPACESYVGIDLAEPAINACRERFADATHASFVVNDGRSLDAVDDGSIDLAFSYDSLVHVEDDVIGGYLVELARKLAPDGVAFLHHSNLAGCTPVGRSARLAARLGRSVRGEWTADFWDRLRATTMSAERFAELAAEAGLVCIGQERVNWLGHRPIDCISAAALPGSRWERPNVVVSNPHFMAEVASAQCIADVWGSIAEGSVSDPEPGGRVRRFGPFSLAIAQRTIGAWSVSVLGPWPRRDVLRRRRRAK